MSNASDTKFDNSSPLLSWPHKMFVWEPKGTYLRYAFLNPLHGHFIHPANFMSLHHKEVLSRTNSFSLARAITGTWKHQRRQVTVLTFQRNRCKYRAEVHCYPMNQDSVIGLVIDSIQTTPQPSSSPANLPRISWPLDRLHRLTKKEQAVFIAINLHPLHFEGASQVEEGQGDAQILCIRTGATNKELAQKMGVSIRTIKANVTSIYQKLHVVSPHHPHHR